MANTGKSKGELWKHFKKSIQKQGNPRTFKYYVMDFFIQP